MVGVANPSPTTDDDQTFLALPVIRVVPHSFDLCLQVIHVLRGKQSFSFSRKQPQGFVAFSLQQYGIEWIW